MISLRIFAGCCAGLAALALGLGYAGQSLWAGAALCAAIGLLWLGGQWRRWDWVTGPCLAGWVGMAAFGAWQSLPSAWMLAGVVAALAAWDLDRFDQRLRGAGAIPRRGELVRAHLRHLVIAAGAGLLLGGIALGARLELTFGWVILIGALAIVGVSGLIRTGSGEDG